MSGYKVTACDLEDINPKFICPSCGLVVRDPVQLTCCGQHYCEKCLRDIRRHQDPVCCLRCNQSLRNVDSESFVDRFVVREIQNIQVTCLNKRDGCCWEGELKSLETHCDTCEYRPLPCRNNGCTSDIPACKLANHEEQCAHLQVVCEHCNSPQMLGGLQDHVMVCPNVLVDCTNCGWPNIPRNELNCHTDPLNGDCPLKPCPFRRHGCLQNELMNQQELCSHLEEKLKEHHLLLLKLVETSMHHQQCQELHPQATGIREALSGAEAKLEDHTWALRTHYDQMSRLRDDVSTLFGIVAGVGERIKASYEELKQEYATMKNRLAALEMCAGTLGDLDNRMNGQAELARERHFSLLGKLQALSCQNEVQYDGLLWIISDVSSKVALARGNPEIVLSSPPFYTNRHGYKAYIRLYLNGHEHDWNENISVFFVLMVGEYDRILEWPFLKRVEVRVMGQGDHRGDDVVADFRLQPVDASCTRPVYGVNIAHCTLPLAILRRGAGFVEDGTMFIKVTVSDK